MTLLTVPDGQVTCGPIAVQRYALLEAFYRSQGYKLQLGRSETLWAIADATSAQWLAAVRLLPQAEGAFWLRNMLVVGQRRHQGLGRLLLQQLLPATAAPVYCFSLPDVVDFYHRQGFVMCQPEQLPVALAQRYNTYRARGRDWVLMGYIGKLSSPSVSECTQADSQVKP